MGEALLVSRGARGSSGYQNYLVTQIFTENTTWIAPKAKDQSFSVRIFGGGAKAVKNVYSGGGGGFMNNNILEINAGDAIDITIGLGGGQGNTNNGGTTSFGDYMYALGGYAGDIMSNGAIAGYGGSGPGFLFVDSTIDYDNNGFHGCGLQFGGGGHYTTPYGITRNIGSGGQYGGGGGGYNSSTTRRAEGGLIYNNLYSNPSIVGNSGLGGYGGSTNLYAMNGTNTIGLGLEFEGAGIRGTNNHNGNSSGNSTCCGGGGYGGNGGNQYGGGGGYGAKGGDVIQQNNYMIHDAAGGGGGYGGDGGDGGASENICCIGGGGGYGKSGKGGGIIKFITNNSTIDKIDGGIAAGGACYLHRSKASAYREGNGGNGICIIQYYI